MSLSGREQQVLNSITDRLASSAPELAALLATFSQLASGEEMPAAEKIMAGWRQAAHRHASRIHRRLGSGWYAILLWLVITIAIVGTGIALSSGSNQSGCPRTWATICVNSASTQGPRPAAGKAVVSHSPQSAIPSSPKPASGRQGSAPRAVR
jgi:hypothetical protein